MRIGEECHLKSWDKSNQRIYGEETCLEIFQAKYHPRLRHGRIIEVRLKMHQRAYDDVVGNRRR